MGNQKQILAGFGVDVDAVAGWLGSYGGEDSPMDISRGLFSGELGTPRERLIEHIGRHAGVRWCTMEEMAEDFRRRHPFRG